MGVKDEPNLGEGKSKRSSYMWSVIKVDTEGQQVDEKNYKADSQFSTHLRKSEGASAFSKNKTLREQREYLPAFAVREELMAQIRDHQGTSKSSWCEYAC